MRNDVEFRDGWLLYDTVRGEQDERAAQATVERERDVLREHGLEHAPCLVDMREMGQMTAEARKVYSDSTAAGTYDRIAFVTDSTMKRVAVNFIMRASGKSEESKFFTEIEDAIEWLRS